MSLIQFAVQSQAQLQMSGSSVLQQGCGVSERSRSGSTDAPDNEGQTEDHLNLEAYFHLILTLLSKAGLSASPTLSGAELVAL